MFTITEVELPGTPPWQTLGCNYHRSPLRNQKLGGKIVSIRQCTAADMRHYEPLIQEHLWYFPTCDKVPKKTWNRHEPTPLQG